MNAKHAVIIAAAPGGAWCICAALVTDALVLGSMASGSPTGVTLVSGIGSIPFEFTRGTRCYSRRGFSWMIVKRDAKGDWKVVPCNTEADYQAQAPLCFDQRPTPDTAAVQIGRAYSSVIGLWSPLVTRTLGREMTVHPLDTKFTPVDDAAVRAAAVASWARPQDHPMVYTYPLDPAESAAALAGTRPLTHTLNWPAVANDVAVAGLLTLLVASQPRRAKRRRELRREPYDRPLTNCPACQYELAGLMTDEHGDRTCPECGRVCGQFF